jgi:hypothetical protein
MSAASSLALRVDSGGGAGRKEWLRDAARAPSGGAQSESGDGGDVGDDDGIDEGVGEEDFEEGAVGDAVPRTIDASEDAAAGLIASVARASAAWSSELGEAGKIEAALTILARM